MITDMAVASSVGSSFDFEQLAGNIGILATFIVVAYAGFKRGLKLVKGDDRRQPETASDIKIKAAMLMETATLNDWTASNRHVADVMEKLTDELKELRHEMELSRAVANARKG